MGFVYPKFVIFFFRCIATPKTFNFYNFHRIKFEFGFEVDFGTLISNLTQKLD